MTIFKKVFPAFLVAILLLFPAVQSVQAKDTQMEDWLIETGNPAINDVVTEFNKTSHDNWYVNLSKHLVKADKKGTIEKLNLLRDDIKQLKKETDKIEAPSSAKKKDKKEIKNIKKHLIKSLDQTDASAKKLVERIEKEKKIKSIKPRKNEQKNMDKVNTAYEKLNKSYTVDASALELSKAVKIDKKAAEKIILDDEEEKKEIATKKEKAAEKKEQEEAEKKRLAEEKAAEEQRAAEEAQRIEEEKKATEEAQRIEEERRAAEEAQRIEEERRAAEEALRLEAQQQAEEEAKAQQQQQVQQETAVPSTSENFKNCTELRTKYPNGVASDHPAYQPKMDRDKDNWACER